MIGKFDETVDRFNEKAWQLMAEMSKGHEHCELYVEYEMVVDEMYNNAISNNPRDTPIETKLS